MLRTADHKRLGPMPARFHIWAEINWLHARRNLSLGQRLCPRRQSPRGGQSAAGGASRVRSTVFPAVTSSRSRDWGGFIVENLSIPRTAWRVAYRMARNSPGPLGERFARARLHVARGVGFFVRGAQRETASPGRMRRLQVLRPTGQERSARGLPTRSSKSADAYSTPRRPKGSLQNRGQKEARTPPLMN